MVVIQGDVFWIDTVVTGFSQRKGSIISFPSKQMFGLRMRSSSRGFLRIWYW